MSQEALGAEVGVRLGSIYRYEAGKQEPKLHVINALAAALGCDVGWLMTGEVSAHRDDSAKPMPPNLEKFLQTELGRTVTPDQRETLLSMVKHYHGDTTVAGWRTVFTGLFDMRPEQHESSDEDLGGLMKVKR